MTSQTITIPAREVRPGDVLFGMTVEHTGEVVGRPERVNIYAADSDFFRLHRERFVTVERPVPSDPIGTVRAEFVDEECVAVLRKCDENAWFSDDGSNESAAFGDDEVSDFPILWKPGMPIPTEGAQA